MDLTTQIIVIVSISVIFFIALMPLAKVVAINMRKEAPISHRLATSKERAYFKKHYVLAGTKKGNNNHIELYLRTLSVAEGVLLEINSSSQSNGDDYMTTYNGTVKVGDETFKAVEFCDHAVNLTHKDHIDVGDSVILFCAVDESGQNKVLTAARKVDDV